MATTADDTKTKTATRKSARASGAKSTKATPEARKKRSQSVASKSKASKTAQKAQSNGKGLADLFEHALADIYYSEKKIYKSLPKMIKAADHPDLIAALTQHREETADQIEKLEQIFALLDQRPRAEKCDAIDGILEEGDGLLEDFGDSMAADAAIIFSCQAVEHYEITRYGSMAAFADALGMDEAKALLDEILAQESATDTKLSTLAEDSVNDAAADYDEDSEAA
ncbi:ferritin-like domain-containing protein [Paracoccus liaowanqingii]|uniref:Ferritin-like domain-containing protein n=1 Tax=Paracoccus liaowanqingii TaxID=2560053 RepID=A0A4Z1CPZ4_9RHOB|nr:ferritin-like domain-containing protein [Paracoccus liaowanqingii]TGN67068.1 ferritin-like domain-containing protein [Paracoccus liaowanqingii]